ncbi:hypothetical protein BGZ94_007582 [Podila epigama]|nr:hypothetical protein BGZ94_007582 [Podila epigama]
MVKNIALAAVAVSAIASVAVAQAEQLAFGAPIQTTVWTAGSSATVAWNNDCSDVVGNTTFPITLNQQINNIQQPVGGGPIGYLDCSESGQTTVQVPNVPSGDVYSILVTPGGVLSYSALFRIVGTAANTTTSAAPAPGTSTASASVSATVSASSTVRITNTPSKTVTAPTNAPTKDTGNAAGSVKAGSTAALVILAGVASLVL